MEKKKKKRPRMGEKQKNEGLRGELRLKKKGKRLKKALGVFQAEKQGELGLKKKMRAS